MYLPEKGLGALLSPLSLDTEEHASSSSRNNHYVSQQSSGCGNHLISPKKNKLHLHDSHLTDRTGKVKCMACKVKQMRRDEEASKERMHYFDATQLLKYKTLIAGIVCSHCNSIFEPKEFLKHGRNYRGVTAAAAQFERSVEKGSPEVSFKSDRGEQRSSSRANSRRRTELLKRNRSQEQVMINSFRSAKKPGPTTPQEKELLDSFCEEDIQENVKGNGGANLSNYSVPFVNLSGIFGKKSTTGIDDEERKESALSSRSDRMTVAQTS